MMEKSNKEGYEEKQDWLSTRSNPRFAYNYTHTPISMEKYFSQKKKLKQLLLKFIYIIRIMSQVCYCIEAF